MNKNPTKDSITKTDYNRFVKSLTVKLMIYSGVSTSVLNLIKVGQLDLQEGTIVISGFQLHLPYWTRRQFEFFYEKLFKNKEDEKSPLLALYDGEVFPDGSFFGPFIKTMLKNEPDVNNPSSITSLAKNAIIQLIDVGLNRDTIMQLTDYKKDIFDSCMQIIGIENTVNNKQIDISLKRLDSYDYL